MDDKANQTAMAPEALPVQEISPAVKEFYERYKLALKSWFETHPRQAPPVIETPAGLRWVNRAERRRVQKKQPNKMKLYVHNYR